MTVQVFLSLKNIVKEIMEEESKKLQDIHPLLDHYNPEMNERIGRKLFEE